jgi:hypothetical protein
MLLPMSVAEIPFVASLCGKLMLAMGKAAPAVPAPQPAHAADRRRQQSPFVGQDRRGQSDAVESALRLAETRRGA